MLSLPRVATVVLSHGISVHTKRNTSAWSVLCHTSRAFLRAPGLSAEIIPQENCKSDWKATVVCINLQWHLSLSNIMWGCFGELEITRVDWFKMLVGHNSMSGRITIISFHDHIQTVLQKGVFFYREVMLQETLLSHLPKPSDPKESTSKAAGNHRIT